MHRAIGLIVLVLVALSTGGCTAFAVGAAGGYSTGTTTDDGAITASVESTLKRSVNASRIDVYTRNGVVTLRGAVVSVQARDQAGRLAAQTRGVRSVINQLEVSPESGG